MSQSYVRFSWITLVLIFLVMAAGSIVRTTGSGMGCPDWPKCFDQIIPPTSVDQLPDDYKQTYSDYRKKKIEKFARLIGAIGFKTEAAQLVADQSLLVEEDFNAARTWTEYGNRLVGFLAGNAVLILFIWTLIRYRTKRKLLLLTFLNLILMGFEGWLGSIVVATNLVPWTITLHMFFALVIVGIQIKIIRIAKDRTFELKLKPTFKYLFYFSLALTFVQIILGAQVRQEVDFLVIEGVDRSLWIDGMVGEMTGFANDIDRISREFLIHRSFSWLLLVVNGVLLWMNYKESYGMQGIKIIVGLLLLLFVTGVMFSYAGMPAMLQPIHLLGASIMLGIQFYSLDYFKYKSGSLIR